jgi:2-polyprenyl-6-methoxyphenol hydroxylase-like FAD-dependent oxidoreductase
MDCMRNGIARTGFPIGKRAVVIGAGISGLAAARALADHFEEVVAFERDEFPSGATPRPGAPQGTQAHGLLGGAMKGLEELFPDFAGDLVQVGAAAVNPGCEVLMEYPGMDPFPLQKWDWLIYSLTRPLIELTMRRRVERQSNITLRGGCRVVEIVGSPDGAFVSGVRFQTAAGPELISADLVVDASKHGALTLSFLQSAGRPLPEETTIGVDIRYATALYSLSPGVLGEFKAIVTFPKAPEGVHAAYLLPVQNNCWQLLLIGRGDDAPPVDGDEFLAYTQNLRTPTISNAMKGAKRLSDVARYGFAESKWRHFAQLDSFPRGLLPMGDAICCLNPVYGQGITVAVQEANALRRLLNAHTRRADPLATLGSAYLAEAEAIVEAPWAISAIPDFIYPQTRGKRPDYLEDRLKFQIAITRMATRDGELYKLLSEVRNLLKPLSVLDEPELARRVEAELAAV